MANRQHYIFIDESGDPGKPFETDRNGDKIPTGASLFYILTAIYLDSQKLFALEHEIMRIREKFGWRSELKSTTIPLTMYKELLEVINTLEIPIYYRLIDKRKYKGQFATAGHARLHNIFDDYNLGKVVLLCTKMLGLLHTEVVIDRADRRMYNRDYFASFDKYLFGKVNTKTIIRVQHVTHVNSEYVNAMQISDLISGAVKDYFTGKNKELRSVINKKHLYKIY
ncbi:MAG: hypothetical protein COV07_01270 [Candidatus Vogelbacteria bacterium CG10_big_fil_rev_8_21_14_0_10_45_14]|uniref:DUF3800 domain-containing protein n=1 Tax=Candidatus Vogelbacteria bacterium CG10_big_fil_rev_8_21_14_0_10_45_14 TaxID=1975042 RepID=A0A2H0RKG1_9BACT|nr:MAG: hypothetical protein COV07_01270 [Candidatus Vogelbacteria bacterium CG10_big_fil_rev_8_21_14_0_10_45_14]